MTDEQDRGEGPPRLERVTAAGRAFGAPEVTPAAAFAAGLDHAGALAPGAPLHLCYLAAAGQATGRLELDAERARFAIHFKRGEVEHAASSAPEDDVGRFLVVKRMLRADALADAERVRESLGGDLVTSLANLGLLNLAESFRVLQEHGIGVVARALLCEKGSFAWSPRARAPPSSFPLGPRWGLPCDAARRLDGLAVRRLLGERAQRVAARSCGRVELAELRLTAHEARAASLFDGKSSPAALAAAHPGDADAILRVALLLAEMELLAFGGVVAPAPIPAPPPASARDATATPRPARPDASDPARVVAAKPRGGRASASPTAAAAAKPAIPQDPESLRATYARLADADHFEALGVKREATAAQIKAAYFALARTYHPDAAPASEPGATKKLRADIFARLGEAWHVLEDDAERARYAEQLASGGVGEVDVSGIFQAEQDFEKAVVLVRTRQYERALASLEAAISRNAAEPEFLVWKAWVEFLLAADKNRQAAASAAAIEGGLKENPRCIPAYLFLAQMAKHGGDMGLAERHLRRGLALDPESVELARELKFLRK